MTKILVDIDGVVADMIGKMLPVLNKKHNTNYTHKDIKTWDFFSKTSTSKMLTDEEKETMRNMLDEPEFARNIPIIENSLDTLQHLSESGCDITWLTAQWESSKTWCFDRTQWAKENLWHISKKIIYTWNKEEVQGDILIDDNPEFVVKWLDRNYKGHARGPRVFLFKQPWNEQAGKDFNLPVLDGWKDKKLLETILAHKITR